MRHITARLAALALTLAVSASTALPVSAALVKPKTVNITYFARPTCAPTELVGGMCMAKDMAKAVATTRSKAFQAEIKRIVADAEAYLDQQTPSPDKVIITDLDDTLVDTSTYYEKHPKFDAQSFYDWLKARPEGLIQPDVLALLKRAKAKGYNVMFITGRPAYTASRTLDQVNVLEWDGEFLKPVPSRDGVHRVSSSKYKPAVHMMLRSFGYKDILNIGDQESDFEWPIKTSDGEFLLPNVMYFVP